MCVKIGKTHIQVDYFSLYSHLQPHLSSHFRVTAWEVDCFNRRLGNSFVARSFSLSFVLCSPLRSCRRNYMDWCVRCEGEKWERKVMVLRHLMPIHSPSCHLFSPISSTLFCFIFPLFPLTHCSFQGKTLMAREWWFNIEFNQWLVWSTPFIHYLLTLTWFLKCFGWAIRFFPCPFHSSCLMAILTIIQGSNISGLLVRRASTNCKYVLLYMLFSITGAILCRFSSFSIFGLIFYLFTWLYGYCNHPSPEFSIFTSLQGHLIVLF